MKRNLPFLKHILIEIDFLLNKTNNITFENFISDDLLTRGCTRSLEIIGEAVKNLSPDLRRNHKEVDWKRIAGMRDKLIHYYFGVNYDILWQVIRNRLPDLREKVQTIMENLEEN
jgi:uncharacterized protein with HEPN domain